MIVFLHFEEKKRPLVFHTVENCGGRRPKRAFMHRYPHPLPGREISRCCERVFLEAVSPGRILCYNRMAK